MNNNYQKKISLSSSLSVVSKQRITEKQIKKEDENSFRLKLIRVHLAALLGAASS
jgi:hypothetical protein